MSRSSQSRTTLEKWDQEYKEAEPDGSTEYGPSHFVRVSELFGKRPEERQAFRKQLTSTLLLSDTDQARLELNLAKFDEVLSKDPNILQVSTIDEGQPPESRVRKSEAEVVEIFVRINTQGTRLSRSDLMFSMLKLSWKQSAKDLPAFVADINEGNRFEIDSDFVIRCLMAVSDLGTKFDVDLLRKQINIASLRNNFSRCCDAIRSTIDFVQNDCWCSSSQLLGGYETLVPFVYYLSRMKDHQVRSHNIPEVRKALYLFAFARPFSRYADSRLWNFIKNEIQPLMDGGDDRFPFERAVRRVATWEGINTFGELINANTPLALHVVQELAGSKVQYRGNLPEIDHIFPRAELRKRRVDDDEINHFANFWILAKTKNRAKSDQDPSKYFADVPDEELRRALIDRSMLTYDKFPEFLALRSQKMLDRIQAKLGFSNDDFAEQKNLAAQPASA